MNEREAREVTLLEAFESADPPDPRWSAEDRAWADRVAIEAAGADAPLADFVALRAGHAQRRLLAREPRLANWLAQPAWLQRWPLLIALGALLAGFLSDRLDPGRRINLLEPPLWGVIAWNVVVYIVGLGVLVLAPLRRGAGPRGSIAETLRRWLHLDQPPGVMARGPSERPWRRFIELWPVRHGRLTALRLQGSLHLAAAALALGLIVGLYVRGLVHDYRVNWESTFLSPGVAHAMVTTLLDPASRLSGIALPDQEAFAALRAAHGDPAAVGAPAAGWIHLLALTLALLVVLPRLLLATACFGLARWRAARFAVPLDAPYYRRIAGLRRGTPARVQIWPYARAPSARAALALRARCAEAFGPRVGVDVEPTVAFGTEDDVPLQGAAAASHAIALFDLSATPERENQGRFVARLAGALAPTAALAVVVDASGFRERFGDLPERLAQRREAWRAWAEPLGLAPCFLDLEAPAEPRSADALEAAFAVPMRERTAATR